MTAIQRDASQEEMFDLSRRLYRAADTAYQYSRRSVGTKAAKARVEALIRTANAMLKAAGAK